MNISCVICSDLLTPQAEIHITPCGHMFHYHCLLNWLERSRTCPQCRNKTTTSGLHKVYFNLACENVLEDASTLQNKLDSLEFQMKLKEKDIQNYKEKYKKAKLQSDGLRAEVARLEDTERVNHSTMLHLKDQINFFKKKSREADKANEEMFQLRQKIKDMENIETVIKGSRQDVENILKNENNVESLALLASTLKKSLVDSENKRRNFHQQLKKSENAHLRCDKTIAELRSESDAYRKQLEASKVSHEKEVRFLKDKYEQLHKKLTSSDQLSQSVNSSIQRIILESPVNYNTPVLNSKMGMKNTFSPAPKSAVLKSRTTNCSEVLSAGSHLSHLIGKTAVSSSTNNVPNSQTKVSSRMDPNRHNSIFKSQEPSQLRVKPREIVYNGLGGSSKEDIFPQPDRSSKSIKRPKTGAVSAAKMKKLSPSAGQKKKVTDFF